MNASSRRSRKTGKSAFGRLPSGNLRHVLDVPQVAFADNAALAFKCRRQPVRVLRGRPRRSVRHGERLADVNEIRVWGRDGNDKITVLLADRPALIHGGAGDDRIIGGLGPNLIFGGADSDKLVGGIRNDLLVGGDGLDVILDASGDDLLVGGNVSNQFTDDFLRHVIALWGSGQSESDRFKDGLTDDEATDSLFDSLGDDWFVLGEGDSALDFNPFDDDTVQLLN
jgi:hypothetical protein